jgi:hypothetical protein
MKRRSLAIGTVLLALAACAEKGDGNGAVNGVVSGPPGTLSVWTQGVSRKIQPTTAPGSGTAVSVATYRDAWASWQLVVRGNAGILQQVTVAVDADLTDGMGHTLTKDNVTFFREYFINLGGLHSNTGTLPVPESSPTGDSNVPDPLIPLIDPYTGANAGQPFDVGTNLNQPVFIDVYVPAGTTAGTYTGTIHVAASRGMSADVPLSVTVWDLDLPDMRTVTTHFKMSITGLPQYHAGLSSNTAFATVTKRYEELAHTHRIDTGQQLVPYIVDGCTVPTAADWTAFDAVVGPYLSGSYFSDGVPSSRMDVPFSPGESFGIDGACGPGAPMASQDAYAAISEAWSEHLDKNGWLAPSIVYAFDEPPASELPQIAKGSAWLQAGDPAWKAHVMDTTSPTTATAPVLDPALGIYTVALPWYGAWNGTPYYGRTEWPALFAQGIQLWFYTGNAVLPPYPTISTDTLDGFEPLIQLWGSWYEKATGFLYWDMASWDAANPWGPENTWDLPGDGVLIYPGNHDGTMAPAGSPSDVAIDGPIPSYRLKMLRQGLQDWALFRLADQKGVTSVVQQQMAAVYTQFGGISLPSSGFYWKTDDAAMATVRAAVVQAILAQ